MMSRAAQTHLAGRVFETPGLRAAKLKLEGRSLVISGINRQ